MKAKHANTRKLSVPINALILGTAFAFILDMFCIIGLDDLVSNFYFTNCNETFLNYYQFR